jgi:hypothetical protein
MSKIGTLTDVAVIATSAPTINANWDVIEAAFANTLSLDGSTPNSMEADIDLNSNDLLNANAIDCVALTVDGTSVDGIITAAAASAAAAAASASTADTKATAAATYASDALASANLAATVTALEPWSGPWLTATAYVVGALAEESGNTYICVVAHTSGTFATDLAAVKWELFASRGATGAGSGDLVSTNNLSDVTSAATSRTNLGVLGTADTGSITGSWTFTQDLNMGNNQNILWADLAIRGSSGISSKIVDTSGGFFQISSDTVILFDNGLTGGSKKTMASMYPTGAVTLHYADAAKIATSATGVTVTGAVSADTAAGNWFLDEDDMASDSATKLSSQQAIKAYVDANKVGAGQSFSSPVRASNTTYQNTTGESIEVYIVAVSGTARNIQVSPDNVTWYTVGHIVGYNTPNYFRVPDNYYYKINGSATVTSWTEVS